MVAGSAVCPRIERRFPVDEKQVMVMPVGERNLDQPCAIRLTLHGMRTWIPIIEVSHQEDLRCVGSHANEVYGLGHVLSGISLRRGYRLRMKSEISFVWSVHISVCGLILQGVASAGFGDVHIMLSILFIR